MVVILSFIYLVNEYPIASMLLHNVEDMTLAVGMRQYLYRQKYLWGGFAVAVLSVLPTTILFLVSQRYLVSGMSDGAVKG